MVNPGHMWKAEELSLHNTHCLTKLVYSPKTFLGKSRSQVRFLQHRTQTPKSTWLQEANIQAFFKKNVCACPHLWYNKKNIWFCFWFLAQSSLNPWNFLNNRNVFDIHNKPLLPIPEFRTIRQLLSSGFWLQDGDQMQNWGWGTFGFTSLSAWGGEG